MIAALNPLEYGRLQGLFAGMDAYLVVDSILEGNTPAWGFADFRKAPQAALLWNRQDALLLVGDSKNREFRVDVAQVITSLVVPDARRRYIPEMAIFYDPRAWRSALPEMLVDLSPAPAERYYFQPGEIDLHWRRAIPKDCRLVRITTELLAERERPNIAALRGWVNSFWRTDLHFDQTGFGYSLLHGESIASWCLTVYASGAQYELGVATAPEYRGRGYATLTALACRAHAAERKYQLHWHCWADNPASRAVARKAGFINPKVYSVYRFSTTI